MNENTDLDELELDELHQQYWDDVDESCRLQEEHDLASLKKIGDGV